MMKICIVSLFFIIFSVIILKVNGNLSDRIVLITSREEDPKTWFDEENPEFQYIGQLSIGGTRYVRAKLRNANCEDKNVFKEDPAVKLLRKKQEMLWVKQEETQRRIRKKTTTNDTEWHNLWYLNGDVYPSMKVTEAWSKGYSGKNVTVAVVDDGLQTDHTDLSENIDIENGFSIRNNTNNPYPRSIDVSHGTRVTGLIAAVKDNNECIPGVAFHCTVIGIQVLDDDDDEERCDDTVDSDEAAALKHYISNVDIYSNSWGPDDEGYDFAGPGMLTEKVLLDGVTTGRNGKGVIYVFAAGNGGITDNCNADGYANSMYTIAITSVANDIHAEYAEVCAPALAATYGGSNEHRLLTTTTPWSDCTSDDIEGTSFSAPIASGIIALTLEANPNLTWRDIQHLIVLTSKRYNFKDTFEGWLQNGVFLEYSQIMGFGLMDAEAMVLYGAEWETVPEQQTCSVDSKNYTNDLFERLSDTIHVTAGLCSTIQFLEHVKITVSFSSYDKRGNFEITLKHVDFGTTTKLLHPRINDMVSIKDGFTWTFMSVHLWGETSIGYWKLTITNKISMAASIHRWSIQFYGTKTDPLSTATYYLIVSFDSPLNQSSTNASSNYTLCIELKAKLEEYWRNKLGRGFYRLVLDESTSNVTHQRVFINKTEVDSMVKEIYNLVHGEELIGFGNIASIKVWNLERHNETVLLTSSTLENELCSIRTTLSPCSFNQICNISNGKPSCLRNDYVTETHKDTPKIIGFVASILVAIIFILVVAALFKISRQRQRTEKEGDSHSKHQETGYAIKYLQNDEERSSTPS